MVCLECGNCQQTGAVYYCTARNEFVTKESEDVRERMKGGGWKKGAPAYETRRRQVRKLRMGTAV